MIRLVLISLLLLLWAVPVQAAEVLQVRSSSLLQVGDHNRTYTAVSYTHLTLPTISWG